MAKLGLDSFSYHRNMTGTRDVCWFLEKVVDLGLDGCQVDPIHLRNWDPDLVREIGKFCALHGLYLELGSGGFDYDHLRGRIELAAEAGARAMRTFIGGDRWSTPQERRVEIIGYATENFRRLAGTAERVGVPLALENHEDLTSLEIAGIIDAVQSPFIRTLVDTGNGLCVGEDPVECVRRLAPYAAATHLKDWKVWWEDGVPQRQGCALGQGDARVREAYAILRSARPDMPITIEIAAVRPGDAPMSVEEEDRMVVESVGFARADCSGP